MKSFLLLLLYNTVLVGFVQSGYIYDDLANFCSNNGLVFISLTTTGETPMLHKEAGKAFMTLENHKLRTRRLTYPRLLPVLQFNLDTMVILTETNIMSEPEKFLMYLKQIGKHRIRKTVMVFSDELSESQEMELKDSLQGLVTYDAWFTIMYQKPANMTAYKNILSINNSTKTLMQDIKFNKVNQMVDEINMEEITIYSSTLSWMPYFSITNCDDMGKNCDIKGFLSDYMDAICRIINCTWTSHAPPDGSWGVRPISGPFNLSGVWGGAMGNVVNGDYHVSLSQWVWTANRYGLLDFVSTSTNAVVLALTPQPPEVDPGLFIRPFRNEAWYGIGVMFIIILIIIIGPYAFFSYYEKTDGFNIAAWWSWMFFVLINAYYGGALTMFFTSELTLPFNSIEDVMKVYPDWKLQMMTGNDVHFQYKALAGDPLYSAFWDRVQNEPEDTVFSNLREGLDKLKTGRYVIHTMTGMLKGFFKSNPFHQQNLKVFAKGRAEFYSLIVPINSPLKPILQTASNSLTEAGARDYLLKQWEGTGIPQAGAVEVMVLTAGQVILVFFIVLGTFSMAWVAFFCELCHKTIKDFKKARAEKFDSRGTTGRKTGKKHGNQLPKDLLKYPNDKSKWGDFYANANDLDERPIKRPQTQDTQIIWY